MLENELVSAVLHDTYGDNNIQGWYFLLIQSGIKTSITRYRYRLVTQCPFMFLITDRLSLKRRMIKTVLHSFKFRTLGVHD